MSAIPRWFAGASLLFVVMAAASPASAATRPTAVTGKITKVTSTTLTVKTSTGVVTGKMSSIAVVTKSARATLSQITKGAFVTLSLASNGKTVTRINIGTAGRFGGPRRTGRPPQARRTGARPPGAFAGRAFHGGQVVSVKPSQISLKSFQGKTAAYPLSKAVAVTRSVRGTRADLRVGETVRIIPIGSANSSFSITIVSG